MSAISLVFIRSSQATMEEGSFAIPWSIAATRNVLARNSSKNQSIISVWYTTHKESHYQCDG